jgi:hypothetical protein
MYACISLKDLLRLNGFDIWIYLFISSYPLVANVLPFLGSLDSMDRLNVSLFTSNFRSSPSPPTPGLGQHSVSSLLGTPPPSSTMIGI